MLEGQPTNRTGGTDLEFRAIQKGDPLWDTTIAFAAGCSWRAGAALAAKMRANDFLPWERVFIAVEDGQIAGYCTLTEKDELPPEYGFSPFIGFVFVDERHRGQRLSEKLIGQTLRYAGTLGCQKVYIMSGEQGLYEKYGFRKLGDYRTIYGSTDQLFCMDLQQSLCDSKAPAKPAVSEVIA
jgi:predicted N-acetyltransferase YhbS